MHMPGTQIPISDALSRAPTKDEEAQLLEEVCNLSLIDVPDHRLNEIRGATQKDETLKCLMDTISNGWPEDKNQQLTQQHGQLLSAASANHSQLLSAASTSTNHATGRALVLTNT
ncbi:hypothetical protein RRG08_036915 [Elysia crispata]|uniref:Uncharacterized protein n=1 Tax=Elysia crispata TaxID=231223 RepID=A0AAE0ZIA9_9GAST|nr:hypothetical protein RRG08_036915 [Elysia crispata]